MNAEFKQTAFKGLLYVPVTVLVQGATLAIGPPSEMAGSLLSVYGVRLLGFNSV